MMLHHRSAFFDDVSIVNVIKNGDTLKIITKADSVYICYEFGTYTASGQYEYVAEYICDVSGVKDTSKINFAGAEVHPPNTMFTNASIYGNHGWIAYRINIGAHTYDHEDIGTQLTRDSDGKKFVITGIFNANEITVIGEPQNADMTNALMYAPADGDTFNGSTITASTATEYQTYAPILHTHAIYLDGDVGSGKEMVQNGSQTTAEVHIYNYASTFHIKSVYAYLVENAGNFPNDTLTNSDFFPIPSETLVPIQDRTTHYIIYPDSTMIVEEIFTSNVAYGGVDSPEIKCYSPLDCKLDSSRMYFPKLTGVNPDTDTYPSRLLPTSMRDYDASKDWWLADHDTEFQTKKSLADRILMLDATAKYGVVNGMLSEANSTIWGRQALYGERVAADDFSCRMQALNGKIGMHFALKSDREEMKFVGYKKFLVNPDTGVYTSYYTITYGDVTYLYCDFHSTIPAGHKIQFPTSLVGRNCEVIEQTTALTIASYPTVTSDGVSVSYTASAGDPYAFVCFRTWRQPSRQVLATETSNYIARVDAMSDRYANAIDTFIRACKSNGIFTTRDFMYLFAHETEALSIINLISSSYAITKAGTTVPTFTAYKGWTGSDAGYLDTGFNPYGDSKNFKQSNGSFGVFMLNGVSSGYTNGAYGAGATTLETNYLGACSSYPNHKTPAMTYTQLVGSGKGYGMFGFNVTDSTHQSLYKNGIEVDTDGTATSALNNSNLWLLGRNSGGYNSGQLMAFAHGGASMDASQTLELYYAVEQLLFAIGTLQRG